MSRSLKLGHCVCNPRLPCPCPTFVEHNICQCAGEKLPPKQGPIALTRYVRKAGCASKIGQADLTRILATLPPVADPNVLVGSAAGDDAGIYRLDDERNLVLTVDVFTPVVDDPYLFGQIAAANSVSDVYAMGGRPLTALSIIGFPIDELDGAIMEAILRGGVDKLAEAGCSVIGGHSFNDEEIKFGFAVTGLIAAGKTIERNTARPGDALVLTKPLGTGMISFAAQLGRIRPAYLEEVGAWMAALNKDASELMVKYEAHACTDVTGYGLAGHLVEMVRHSGASAEIDLSAVPVFAAVRPCLENELLSGAIESNQEYAMAWVRAAEGEVEGNLAVLYDPQTSGGLLISLPEDKAKALVEEMHGRGHAAAAIIGRVVEKGAGRADSEVLVKNMQMENFIGDCEAAVLLESEDAQPVPVAADARTARPEAAAPLSCCDTPPVLASDRRADAKPHTEARSAATLPAAAEKELSMDAPNLFTDFMKEATQPGLIDARNKRLMAVALSVAQRCAPCARIHIKNALSEGVSRAEIDEAAWLAISFTGCSGMMFYKDICADLNL